MQWRHQGKSDDSPTPGLLWCDEYRYGTEFYGFFDLYYDDYIAGSGTHGDGDYLWNSDHHSWDSNHVVLYEPYTGKVLVSFTTSSNGPYMGFDGEYLWFGHCGHGQGNMIKCVEIGGETGPYDPIEYLYYMDGLEGYDENIYIIGAVDWDASVIKFNRNGVLLDYFELDRPDNYFGSWEDIAVDPDGNIWAFFDSMEFEDPNFL